MNRLTSIHPCQPVTVQYIICIHSSTMQLPAIHRFIPCNGVPSEGCPGAQSEEEDAPFVHLSVLITI
jgi:hypothetical protein